VAVMLSTSMRLTRTRRAAGIPAGHRVSP